MRLDAVDEVAEQFEGTGVGGVDSTDDEKENGDNETTGGVRAPCRRLTPILFFSSAALLERAAE